MKTANQHHVESQLLARITGALKVSWFFWGSAVGLGCAVFWSAEPLLPLWMSVCPRPSTYVRPLLNTPLARLATFLPIFLLYVPDVLLLFGSGVFAAACVRRRWLAWLSTCVAAYAFLDIVAVDGPLSYLAFSAEVHGDRLHWEYIAICLVVLSSAYAGALATICVRSSGPKPGHCPKCGYCLFGLPSAVCPECGRPFSPSEAESDVGEECEESKSSVNECGDVSSPRGQRGKSALLTRILVLVPLVAVYYTLDWMPLRVAQRDATAWSIRASGCDPSLLEYEGSPALLVDGKLHHYSAQCTYIDVVLLVMPFVWVFGASRRSNIQRLGIVALLILGWNFIRCWLAVYLDVAGVSRFYAHDLPNYTIGWATVVVAVVLALRRDFGVSPETASKAREFGGHTREGVRGEFGGESSGDTHTNGMKLRAGVRKSFYE